MCPRAQMLSSPEPSTRASEPEDKLAWFLGSVLGKRYDPVTFNCWTLACLAQSTLFDRRLPEVEPETIADKKARSRALRDHTGRSDWVEALRPVHGSMALMGRVFGWESHCGVYLETADGPAVLHADEQAGKVVLDTPLDLRRRWRISYWVPAP